MMMFFTKVLYLVSFLIVSFSSIVKSQIITTIAGTGTPGYSGDSIPAITAQVNLPTSICRDFYGNIFVADRFNHRIRKIDTNGMITTIAGTGVPGYSGDGSAAINAQLNQPIGLAVRLDGTIYISDNANFRIRKVDTVGVITTIAGTGIAGYSGDGGLAINARFNGQWGLFLDGIGNLFVADRNNDAVRKINLTTDTIVTVAGNGTSGYSGDGGLATAAQLNKPIAVFVDTTNNIYIADENNDRVRKVTYATGVISKIAGTGSASYNGDGIQAVNASLNKPCGVSVDLAGNVYISDRMNQRLRKINTSGTISTIAGTGSVGFSGDGGNAASALLNYPRELFSDGSGNIYFADTDNDRIRKITYCNFPDIPVVAASADTICNGATLTLTVTSGNLNDATHWQWYSGSCGGIAAGTGDSINVTPSVTTTYFVRGEGGCVTPYACASITINVNNIPAQPDSIYGDTAVCEGSFQTYSIAPVAGATSYLWSLPGGWTGNSTIDSINIQAGVISGSILVIANNGCGGSVAQQLPVSVTPLPAMPPYIYGDTLVCPGVATTYYIDSLTGVDNYLWSLPSGWTGVNIYDTMYAWSGNFGGIVSVAASNVCGISTPQTLNVNINTVDLLVIQIDNALNANASPATYQWVTCPLFVPIAGETNQSFIATQNGDYAVIITQNGCTDTSACYQVVGIGVSELNHNGSINLIQNLKEEKLEINFMNPLMDRGTLVLANTAGAIVSQTQFENSNWLREVTIDTRKLSAGIYVLTVVSNKHCSNFKILKQ